MSYLFKKTKVDDILATFNKMITDLTEVARVHDDAATTKMETIARLNQEIDAHQIEANRAERVMTKITEIIGD